MASTDYKAQITQLYNRLTALNSDLSNRCLESRIITLQNTLTTRLNAVVNSINNSEDSIADIQLDLADAIEELRSKS